FDTTGLPPFDYGTKLERGAAYVCEVLRTPDVIGAQVVDTQASLQDLADAIEAACGVAYTAYLEDGNDVGGIDVGFLTRDDRTTVDSSTQYLLASTWPDPECTPAPCAR